MTSTLNQIISSFGVDSVHYGIIVFGTNVTKVLSFGEMFDSKKHVAAILSGLQKLQGIPSLDLALDEAKEMFELNAVRPNATRVLVLIMDQRSTVTNSEIRRKATPLENLRVNVIPIGIGDQANVEQLRSTTSDAANVIKVPNDEDTATLAKRVSSSILGSKRKFIVIIRQD